MRPTDWLGLSLAVVAGVVLVMVTLNTPVPASDLPAYLAMARDGVFDVDQGTWAEGRAFVNGSWLYQRVVFALHGLGGWELLVALNAACVAGALALVGRFGWLRGRGIGAGIAVVLASLLMLQNTAMRPQTAAFLVAAAVMVAPRAWQVGLLTVLWANLHGSFVLAPALAALRDRSLPRVLVAAVAWLANPFGWKLATYVLDNSSLPADRGLDEWSSPELLSPIGVRLFFALVIVVGVGLRKRPALLELLVPGILGLLALSAVRHVAWFGLVAGPMLAGWLPRVEGSSRFARPLFYGVCALSALGVLRFLPWLRPPPTDRAEDAWLEAQAPVEVLTALDRLPPGEVQVPMRVGGLVRWRHPGWTVPVDVRVWLYSDEEWDRYVLGRQRPSGLLLVDLRREPALDGATAAWQVHAEDARWSLRSAPEELGLDEGLAPEPLEGLDDLHDVEGLAAPGPTGGDRLVGTVGLDEEPAGGDR